MTRPHRKAAVMTRTDAPFTITVLAGTLCLAFGLRPWLHALPLGTWSLVVAALTAATFVAAAAVSRVARAVKR